MKESHNIPDISELIRSIEEVRNLCNKHENEICVLKRENKKLRTSNRHLREENKLLKQENMILKKENHKLKEEIISLKHKKNSHNSSMPPSSDIGREHRSTSLRKSSGKKTGGQSGHKGTTLKMIDISDLIEKHFPLVCENCGNSLSDFTANFSGRRQIIDLPKISPIVTEHRIYSKQCNCGHCTKSNYPDRVKTPISYGANIQSLVAYLSARQYVPVDRMHELLSEILNVNLSQGGICYLLNKMANKAKKEHLKIKKSVMDSSVIGADETGANINGDNHWYLTFQNQDYTFIDVHKNRGYKAIIDLFGDNFDNSTLVTDCWPSYFKTNAKHHQICTAHLQRELIGLTQKYPMQTWTMKFNDLILESLKLAKRYKQVPKNKLDQIFLKLDKLLKLKINPKWKEILAFANRMIRYKDFLFNFLSNTEIPPDNNASERAIRNVKVKQKVSGFFKSFKGAQNYATLRSCIDTAIKQGINPWDKLCHIANY
jgi:transposase/FtsZ-binding cell division protein ZapB